MVFKLDRKSEPTVNDPYLVEVSSADIEWLRTIFKKQMGRGPTAQDLKGQVSQLIREQILSREAVAMGIDEGDIVVRRRLAQKMEFLFKDLSAMTEPTEDDLRKYYFENRRKYEAPPQVTFTQVYFSVENRGVEGAKQAAQALINEDGDPNKVSTLGDASILSPGCRQCGEKEISNRFGTDFAEAVKNQEPGSWNGPVKSAYGFHAVYIYERQDYDYHCSIGPMNQKVCIKAVIMNYPTVSNGVSIGIFIFASRGGELNPLPPGGLNRQSM